MTREEAIAKLKLMAGYKWKTPEEIEALNMAISALSENRGNWIEGSYGYYECSKCHIKRDSLISGVFNYCPNCGADMRGE